VVTKELGSGRPIVVLHGGMSDESPWVKVADRLAARFRVILIRRRLYRLDEPVDLAATLDQQVAETLEVARAQGEPCVLVGHSSGAIVALEALVADQAPFAGAVLYEPPSPLDGLPLGLPTTLQRARAAYDSGRPGRALRIFLGEGVGVSRAVAMLAPLLARLPDVRPYVGRQLDDLEMILRLGVRSEAYGRIELPVWFLTGAKSPEHLTTRCVRLAALMPHADVLTLPGTGHGANQSNPAELGDLIADFAVRVLSR
jgi:pimeloyl-ACP methyl ester carboxylesterase